LSGPKNPDGPADPIIMHADVRRMLLAQKAIAEGGRMLTYYLAQLVDIEHLAADKEEKKRADDLLALLTPIAKAFLTETGLEAANLGLQCFGGHGYIAEWGMEQNVRDARISTLYEGTTGIQALDLLGRKVLMTQGELLKGFTKEIHLFCKEHESDSGMAEFVEPLAKLNKEWGEVTMQIGVAAMKNPEEVSAVCVDYLMYSGYITLAYFWAKASKVALENASSDDPVYSSKLKTARFYFSKLLPRTLTLKESIKNGGESMLDFSLEEF
jgi:hypothetical protein